MSKQLLHDSPASWFFETKAGKSREIREAVLFYQKNNLATNILYNNKSAR